MGSRVSVLFCSVILTLGGCAEAHFFGLTKKAAGDAAAPPTGSDEPGPAVPVGGKPGGGPVPPPAAAPASGAATTAQLQIACVPGATALVHGGPAGVVLAVGGEFCPDVEDKVDVILLIDTSPGSAPGQAPTVQAPPDQAPPVQAPPAQAPPVQAPPAQAPPDQAPPAQAPPDQAPPVQAPPAQAPPAQVQEPLTGLADSAVGATGSASEPCGAWADAAAWLSAHAADFGDAPGRDLTFHVLPFAAAGLGARSLPTGSLAAAEALLAGPAPCGTEPVVTGGDGLSEAFDAAAKLAHAASGRVVVFLVTTPAGLGNPASAAAAQAAARLRTQGSDLILAGLLDAPPPATEALADLAALTGGQAHAQLLSVAVPGPLLAMSIGPDLQASSASLVILDAGQVIAQAASVSAQPTGSDGEHWTFEATPLSLPRSAYGHELTVKLELPSIYGTVFQVERPFSLAPGP